MFWKINHKAQPKYQTEHLAYRLVEVDNGVPLSLPGVEVLLLIVLKVVQIPLLGDDVVLHGHVLALPHLVELVLQLLLALRVLCLAEEFLWILRLITFSLQYNL